MYLGAGHKEKNPPNDPRTLLIPAKTFSHACQNTISKRGKKTAREIHLQPAPHWEPQSRKQRGNMARPGGIHDWLSSGLLSA